MDDFYVRIVLSGSTGCVDGLWTACTLHLVCAISFISPKNICASCAKTDRDLLKGLCVVIRYVSTARFVRKLRHSTGILCPKPRQPPLIPPNFPHSPQELHIIFRIQNYFCGIHKVLPCVLGYSHLPPPSLVLWRPYSSWHRTVPQVMRCCGALKTITRTAPQWNWGIET